MDQDRGVASILIVDDDNDIRTLLGSFLEKHGFSVTKARDGVEMQACLARSPHDLAILDLMLPGLNGLEVCQTLRAEGAALPILMLTALTTLEDRVAGLRMGADDYLCKPFEFEELLARLEALARRGRPLRPRPGAQLVVADLVFDRERMRVERAGRPIPLTARELALLELLMSAPGRLFSRERILASVWGTHEDPLTNIVDVYIRRLRSKVDEGFEPALIHPQRGLGYRLEEPPR